MANEKRPRKPTRDEDRFVDAMNAIDKGEVFIAFVGTRDEKGNAVVALHSSDDFSGMWLLSKGTDAYNDLHGFGFSIDFTPDIDDDTDDDE